MELPEALEDAICAAPDDREAYLVAGDWLQDRGLLQGELAVEDDRERMIQLLPPALRGDSPFTIEWRWGFVRGVLLASMQDASEARLLGELLASPIARFVQKLVIQDASSRLIDALFVREPRALRCLRTLMLFGDGELDFARLRFPLRRLVLRGVREKGELTVPTLLELAIDRTSVHLGPLPALEMLQLGTFDAVDPDCWLHPELMPRLRALTLSVTAPLTTRVWRDARIAQQLERLDIFDMTPGMQTERTFVIDRRVPGPAALLAMVGPQRGSLIPLVSPHPLATRRRARHAELQLDGQWTVRRENEAALTFVNGFDIVACPLRTHDEIALEHHVLRFLEGDVDQTAALLRTRYGL
ncbi:MAG: hypothetical protein M4D80_34625 [Myxococcota bacterium]|nr:hypothetical protein [Myxococcota bacterium]